MKEAALEYLLESFFDYKMTDIFTAMVCRVVTVKTELHDQRVDVQPLPRAYQEDGTTTDRPTIQNIPLMFPASSKASLTFPVDVGDTVLCVFSQRSLDSFKASKDNSPYTPQDFRRFSSRDAVAIPGLFSFPNAVNNPAKHKWTHSTRDLVIVNNIGSDAECEVRLKENGNIELKTEQDFYATFKDGTIDCDNLTINCSNMTVNAESSFSINTGTLDATVGTTTTINSPTTNWTGTFNLAGPFVQSAGAGGSATATFNVPIQSNASITVSGADIVADGISLKSHRHPGDSGGTTGTPI